MNISITHKNQRLGDAPKGALFRADRLTGFLRELQQFEVEAGVAEEL